MNATPTPPPADEMPAGAFDPADPNIAEKVIGKQVASWRKEVARLQDLIAAASTPPAGVPDLPIVAWLIDTYDRLDTLHQSVELSPLSDLDDTQEAEPLCTLASAQAAIAAAVAPQSVSVPEALSDDAWEEDAAKAGLIVNGLSLNGASTNAFYNGHRAGYARAVSAAPAAPLPQPQAEADDWTPYLKDGETPFQRLQREIKDSNSLASLLAAERSKNAALPQQGEGSIDSISDDLGFTEVLGEFVRYMADGQPFGSGSLPLTRYIDAWYSARLARTAAPSEHPDDLAVNRFAAAMKAKMAKQRAKGYGGWDDPARCTDESLADKLMTHTQKGDPVDVANFCMMLHQRHGGDTYIVGDVIKIAALDFARRVAAAWLPVAPAPSEPPAIPTDLLKRLRNRAGHERLALHTLLIDAADEIDRLSKDAERYRWLRDFGPENKPAVMIDGRWYGAKLGNGVGFDLDAAIDAALAKKGQP